MVYNKDMVQEQLVDYISAQLKSGVSRDAVKAALVAAGWAAADIEDTFKKVEGAAKPSMPAAGATPAVTSPQSIRVSDLISASGAATSFSVGSASGPAAAAKPAAKTDNVLKPQSMKPASMDAVMSAGGPGKKKPILTIALIVVIAALAGLSGYLYYQNMAISGQASSVGAAGADVAAQVASLTDQVQALDASNTALTAQIASLNDENAVLKSNLSFVALLKEGTSTETSSISGQLTGGKLSYLLTTPYGITVYVQNAKDPNVIAALKPLVGTTTAVTLGGTHIPGSQYLTVVTVNGTPVSAPATASSTSSSTAQ